MHTPSVFATILRNISPSGASVPVINPKVLVLQNDVPSYYFVLKLGRSMNPLGSFSFLHPIISTYLVQTDDVCSETATAMQLSVNCTLASIAAIKAFNAAPYGQRSLNKVLN
jgi:hypothetical protein